MNTPKDIRALLPVEPMISSGEWRKRYYRALNWAVAGWLAALLLLAQMLLAVWLLDR